MESKQIALEMSLAELNGLLNEYFNKNKDGKGSGYPQRIIRQYAIQEKRKEAVAFASWMAPKYHTADKQSLEEWYDMYLPSLTQLNKEICKEK